MARSSLVSAVVVLAIAICVHAQVYVSPFGNDQGSGSVSQPFQTLSRALGASKAGGTIYMMSGFYTGTKNFGLTLSLQNITFSNYQDSSPVVSCGSVSLSSAFVLSYNDRTYSYLNLLGVSVASCTYGFSINYNSYGTQTLNFNGSTFQGLSGNLIRWNAVYPASLVVNWYGAAQEQNSPLRVFSTNVNIASSFAINSVDFSGGSLDCSNVGTISFFNCSFSNMASAIALSSANILVQQSLFSQVQSAMNVNLGPSKTLRVIGSSFVNNGPVTPIIVNGLSNSDASAVFQNNLFSNNAATSGAGGISMLNCNSGGVFGIQSTLFQANSGTAGGVLFQNSIANLDNVTFTSNTASVNGGGFNAVGTTLFGSSITFTKNLVNGTANSYNCQKNGTVGAVNLVGGQSDAPSTGNCASAIVGGPTLPRTEARKATMLVSVEVARIQTSTTMSWAAKKKAYQRLLEKIF